MITNPIAKVAKLLAESLKDRPVQIEQPIQPEDSDIWNHYVVRLELLDPVTLENVKAVVEEFTTQIVSDYAGTGTPVVMALMMFGPNGSPYNRELVDDNATVSLRHIHSYSSEKDRYLHSFDLMVLKP